MHLLSRLRHLIIALLRRVKGLGTRLFSAEVRTARRALASGLFEPGFYAAQAGIKVSSPEQALEHYLTKGAAAGFLPHPLVDATLAHDPQRSAALAQALSSSGPIASHLFSTAYDWTAYAAASPGASDHPGGVVGHYSTTQRRPEQQVALTLASGEAFDRQGLDARASRQARLMSPILKSGLFDTDYYDAQTGVTFSSPRAALWHYLSIGEAAGFAANPLFEPEWYERKRSTTGDVLLADYISSNLADVAPHPHFDPETYLAHAPDASTHPGGPLGHFLQHATDDSSTWPVVDQATPRRWSELRDALFYEVRAVAEQQRLTAWGTPQLWDPSAERAFETHVATVAAIAMDAPPTISVVFDLARATGRTKQRIAAMLDGDYPALEIVAVARKNDPRLDDLDPRVVVEMTIAPTHAERINAGARRSTGDYLHVWHPRDTVRPTFYRRSIIGLLAAGTELVYSATASGRSHDPLVQGEPYARDGLLWGEYHAVTRTALVSRSLFDRVGGYDRELPAFADWDFVLRASTAVDPVFLPQIGIDADANRIGVRKGTRAYEHVVRARQLCDWQQETPRTPGRVSVLIPVYEDWVMTNQAVRAILETTEGRDVEVVLLDNGSRRAVGAFIEAVHGLEERVSRTRAPKNTNFAMGSNLAFLASTGGRVIFMNNDTIPTPGWLDPLVSELDDPTARAAQPLLLFGDRTVQAAGTVFHSHAFPWHFLQGHPVEDVLRAQQTRFSAITAATMVCRADEVRQLHGFDPIYANGMEDVDLCLRLAETLGGDFRVALDSVVVHAESQTVGRFDAVGRNRALFMERWMRRLPASDLGKYQSADLVAAHYRATWSHPRSRLRSGSVMVVRPPRQVATGPAQGLPSLRWAIKTSATPGPVGDLWGDTFFAEDLARALRRLGQEVVIDRRDSHQRQNSDHLDDVVVALRGLTRVDAQPGATSLLWVISHPEAVSDEELASGFDLVYAASTPWSAMATERSGREVRALLQATDPSRFHPGTSDAALASDALFVGRTRKIFRPVVRDAIEVGADLAIYGDGWDEFIDMSHVRAEHLSNSDLPAAYRSARIVLNDHWSDMAELGFLSNRLFDAAASGSLVVTDEVNGLGDVFGDLVRPYSDVDQLRTLLSADSPPWLGDDERLAQARAVGEQHSFDARARTLLADVLDERGIEHTLRSPSSRDRS